MNKSLIRTIVSLIAQQAAMITFIRVVYLDIFLSAGLAMLVAFVVYFISGLIGGRKNEK